MNNLQDLLKDLKPLHEPEAISAWPPAIGWWLLPVTIAVILAAIIWWWKRAKTPNYKKIALQDLKNVINNYEIRKNSQEATGEVSLLIRKVMVAKYGNNEVAGLIDSEWLMRLDDISQSSLFTEGAGKAIVIAPYSSNYEVDVEQLFAATKKLLGRL
ncbi:MAG: DUF4381 domain-containing protein [Gammaproteobacteria bacterium]|nr:DUF4381 domain-containing protein [Gammaproteobacteria bacterium]